MYVITKFNRPISAHRTLARAWLECFDRGFVVKRGRHRPGTTAAQIKHRLDYGIHIVEFHPKPRPTKKQYSRKTKFKPENWIDQL